MAQIFRKSAIERLSSPEQLDRLIVITSPLSWLALVGVALIIAVIIIWAFFGTVPSTIDAKGIITNGGYSNSVYSDVSGRLTEICVSVDEKVSEGKKIASVEDSTGSVHDIISNQAFVVADIPVKLNDEINCGDELLGISPTSEYDRFVVFYVDIETLPRITAGMKVIVNLPGLDSRKYGHMEAEIVNIDSYATPKKNIKRVAGNNGMIEYLGGENQPVAAVTCKLRKDKDSANGLYWSGIEGKNVSLSAGNVAEVKVIVEEEAPISILIPAYGD